MMRNLSLILTTMLAIGGTAQAQRPFVPEGRQFPCVDTGHGTADCTQAMAELAKVKPEPEPGIAVRSPGIVAEIENLHDTMLQIQLGQAETNRLLAVIAGPAGQGK